MSDHFALLSGIEEQYDTYLELSGLALAPGVVDLSDEPVQGRSIVPLGLTLA